MATKFLEPGGDSDFAVATPNGFWSNVSSASIATDFVHRPHLRSIKFPAGGGQVNSPLAVFSSAGGRASLYIYINVLPTATITFWTFATSGSATVVRFRMTTAGVVQLWENTNQIGTNGAAMTAGKWYRLSLAYTITSTVVNRFEAFLNGVSTISITNATITSTAVNQFILGNIASDATFDIRTSDHYVDDSSALTDTGDIWVTAKRPFSNGTTNGFGTQIGSGGSGYGSGHSPQVNERALSTTNGWSMVGAGSAVTEEYNIEAQHQGDIDIRKFTLVDYVGWVSTSALVGETINIIINGVNFSQAITSTNTLYTKAAGSTTYPAGSGADIGIQTDTSLTTVSLFECGILFAYKNTYTGSPLPAHRR